MEITPKLEGKKMATVLERLKKLDEERAKLVAEAETEARKKLDDALAEYNSLGHGYYLAETDGAKPRKRAQRQADPDKPCNVCNFVTVPPHDGRVHRSQDPKKAFTVKELEEKGYKKRT